MAEAKKVNPAVSFLTNYGEKLALGIAVLALVACAVLWFGLPSDDPTSDVSKGVKNLETEAKTAHAEMTAPNTENWQAKAVNPWTTLVASARPADAWSGSMTTIAKGTAVAIVINRRVPVVVPPVSAPVADVAIDSITVTWSYKDFTKQEADKMTREKPPGNQEAGKVTHFKLEREVNGSGKWDVIDEKLDVKTQSYVDTKIEPKSKYAYRVTAYSTEKPFLERGGKTDENGGTVNPSGLVNSAASAPVQSLGIWKLTFTNPTKPADAAKGMVYVKIEKFEKGVGKVEKAHIHYDGDVIGTWAESDGAEPVSKHRVATKAGKSIEVDFNTAATLITVNPIKLPVEAKRCKPIFDPKTGNKTGCEQIIEKRTIDTAQITFKDDEGPHKIYVPAPNSLDQLCDEHGGRKIIVAPPGGEKPGTPEEPKVDPKEAMKAKKEADAEKLFEEAEKALDKNRTLALTYYNRLMKEYSDTDYVAKNKKATIEERIAALSKKAK